MPSRRNLYTELATATRQQWYDGFIWLAFLVVGALLPLYGGWFLLLLFSQNPELAKFAANGEFALYSAAFLTPALYLIAGDARSPFVHRQLFSLVGIVLLLLSVLVFTAASAVGIMAPETANIAGLRLDEPILFRTSIYLLVGSTIFAFLVNLLDRILSAFDPTTSAAEEAMTLSEEFRATEGSDGE